MIGNSAIIANKHYLMVEDADFDKALESGAQSGALEAQNQAQQPPVGFRNLSQEKTKALASEGLMLNLATSCDSVQDFGLSN